MAETYKEFRNREEQEVATFMNEHGFAAFSGHQLSEGMAKLGVTDDGELMGLYGGIYIRRSDKPALDSLCERLDAERNERMQEPSFAYDAFLYQMWNHEYPINWTGDWDVCSEFGYVEYAPEKTAVEYLQELGFGIEILKAYVAALDTIQHEFYAVN